MRKGFPKFLIERQPALDKELTPTEKKLNKKLLGFIIVSNSYIAGDTAWVFITWDIKKEQLDFSVIENDDYLATIRHIDKANSVLSLTKEELLSKLYNVKKESIYLDRKFVISALNKTFTRNKFTIKTYGAMKLFSVLRDILFEKSYIWLEGEKDGKTNEGILWG